MKKYNLIHEPWILALSKDGLVQEISLKTALNRGDEYVSLCGETKLMDIAILRLLVALIVTILYRYDESGKPRTISKQKEALDAWCNAWKNGISENAVVVLCQDFGQ